MGNEQTRKHKPAIRSKLSSQLKEVPFKIHIALDFGTDGCALAFAYDGQVTVYNKWKTKKRKRAIKAKSQILLSDKDEVVAFGDNAKIIYSSLSGAEKNKWKFFDKFKMELYGADVDEKRDSAESNTRKKKKFKKNSKSSKSCKLEEMYLTSMNGQTCPASIVFVKAFQHLQKIAMEYIHKITKDVINPDEIQWLVTVPAIWSERAKSKMETWIINAELVDPMIKDQCLIVYEPDCAALSIFEQMKDRERQKESHHAEERAEETYATQISREIVHSLIANVAKDAIAHSDSTDIVKRKRDIQIGDKYILVDAGGGTVDIVCHTVVPGYCIQEAHYPTGNKWGGGNVDDEYINLLKDIFSEQWIIDFKKESPNVYLEIIDNFQIAKCKFYRKKKAETHEVELPYPFVQYLHAQCTGKGDDLVNVVARYKPNQNEDVNLDDECLILDVAIWKKLFNSSIEPIINHINVLLGEEILKDQCIYLFLVGGFSASKYFQFKMKKEFGPESQHGIQVVIPKKPTLSVVIGAAHFGLRKNFVTARRLRFTYGLDCNMPISLARKKG
eukprot:50834_1